MAGQMGNKARATSEFAKDLARAFPPELAPIVKTTVSKLPVSELPPSPGSIGPIQISGSPICIPSRLYMGSTPCHSRGPEHPLENAIVSCLYTRHHDGHVRERFLKELLPVRTVWQVPFVIQLVGEYVVELVTIIEDALADGMESTFASFLQENQTFMTLTRQRAISYWNCYHRSQWPQLSSYPGMRVLRRLEVWKKRQEELSRR
jgi:hypothetical protein